MNRFVTLLFFVVCLFSFCKNPNAQVYLAPKYSAPTGFLKEIVNTGFGIELGASSKFYFGVRFRSIFNVEFMNNPNAKGIVTNYSNGNVNGLLSDRRGLKNYIYAGFGGGLDFAPVKFEKFNLYYGLDCLLGFNSSTTFNSRIYNDGSEDTFDDFFFSRNIGFRPRVGIEYPFKFGAFGVEFTRSFILGKDFNDAIEKPAKLVDFHGRYSLGIIYKF